MSSGSVENCMRGATKHLHSLQRSFGAKLRVVGEKFGRDLLRACRPRACIDDLIMVIAQVNLSNNYSSEGLGAEIASTSRLSPCH